MSEYDGLLVQCRQHSMQLKELVPHFGALETYRSRSGKGAVHCKCLEDYGLGVDELMNKYPWEGMRTLFDKSTKMENRQVLEEKNESCRVVDGNESSGSVVGG